MEFCIFCQKKDQRCVCICFFEKQIHWAKITFTRGDSPHAFSRSEHNLHFAESKIHFKCRKPIKIHSFCSNCHVISLNHKYNLSPGEFFLPVWFHGLQLLTESKIHFKCRKPIKIHSFCSNCHVISLNHKYNLSPGEFFLPVWYHGLQLPFLWSFRQSPSKWSI